MDGEDYIEPIGPARICLHSFVRILRFHLGKFALVDGRNSLRRIPSANGMPEGALRDCPQSRHTNSISGATFGSPMPSMCIWWVSRCIESSCPMIPCTLVWTHAISAACLSLRMPATALVASQRRSTSLRLATALARLSGMPEMWPEMMAICSPLVFVGVFGFDGFGMALFLNGFHVTIICRTLRLS